MSITRRAFLTTSAVLPILPTLTSTASGQDLSPLRFGTALPSPTTPPLLPQWLPVPATWMGPPFTPPPAAAKAVVMPFANSAANLYIKVAGGRATGCDFRLCAQAISTMFDYLTMAGFVPGADRLANFANQVQHTAGQLAAMRASPFGALCTMSDREAVSYLANATRYTPDALALLASGGQAGIHNALIAVIETLGDRTDTAHSRAQAVNSNAAMNLGIASVYLPWLAYFLLNGWAPVDAISKEGFANGLFPLPFILARSQNLLT